MLMSLLSATKHDTGQAEEEGNKEQTAGSVSFFFLLSQILQKAYDFMNTLLGTFQGFGKIHAHGFSLTSF